MEPVIHRTHTPRKRNSAKTNVTLSIIFHVIILGAGGLWAAHEGVFGEKLKTLSASILDKEKKAVAKKEEAKDEGKKVEQVKAAEVVKAANTAPPPPAFVPPAAAGVAAPPAAVSLGGFVLDQEALTGGPMVQYKQSLENTLRARWDRPSDIDDATYVAEVELSVDSAGKVLGNDWKRGSGDKRWDDSVKKVVASTKAFSRPPPSGFPEKVLVRFDTEAAKTEPVIQASAR